MSHPVLTIIYGISVSIAERLAAPYSDHVNLRSLLERRRLTERTPGFVSYRYLEFIKRRAYLQSCDLM